MRATDPHPLLARAVEAAFGTDFSGRMAQACREYIVAGGRRSLDQCIGLPVSLGKRRNLVRNHWLQIAQAELQATGDDATPAALHAQLERFVMRGSWSRWRESGGPPADAANLYIALWHAVAANKGRALCCKHLEALLKNRPGNFHTPALPFVDALTSGANTGEGDASS